MKSAFVWGEAALKLYSTTTDAKNILLQASKLEQVMRLLDDRMMMKSILFYPVTRRLRVCLDYYFRTKNFTLFFLDYRTKSL
jgi:hypothetical protein